VTMRRRLCKVWNSYCNRSDVKLHSVAEMFTVRKTDCFYSM